MPVAGPSPPKRASLRGARVAFTGRLACITMPEAQQLVAEAGGVTTNSISGRTAYLVVGMRGWPLKRDGSVSARLQRAERLLAARGRPRIISEARFLELVGRQDEPSLQKAYSALQVADVVGIDPATLERWEYLGLVRSRDGAYDFQDIVSLQTIVSLVHRGVHLKTIQQSMASLAAIVPDADRPLAQLRIVASDDGELLAQIGEALVTPDGQQLLDFDEQVCEDVAVETAQPLAAPQSADEVFHRAVWLEEQERSAEAAEMYRRAIALQPGRAEAYFNLGNVLRMEDRAEAAEEMYRLALALQPHDEFAWYNLADLLEESGEYDEAIAALREALRVNPAFADAHFNLASCLTAVGQKAAARPHWQKYISMDPNSDWADYARRQLV